MTPIEIYGRPGTKNTDAAESFCIKMRYPHVMRDVSRDVTARDELKKRRVFAGALPQIFIGPKHVGGYFDLMGLSPFIVQQQIGE